jgi:hypothetical protein
MICERQYSKFILISTSHLLDILIFSLNLQIWSINLSFPFCCIIYCIMYEILDYLKKIIFYLYEVFDITTKFQANPFKSIHYTHYLYDLTFKQTEDVNVWNLIQYKLKGCHFYRFNHFRLKPDRIHVEPSI